MSTQPRAVARVIIPQPTLEGAGVKLKRSIATQTLDYLDPFLLWDHFGSDNPADFLPGFPMHPHRGIETVTYMLAGSVNHRDSLGNAGTIYPGDMQWMTAGRGIMHEEMPKPADDGRMEGFQLWVNLPAKLKMTQPRYQEIAAKNIPEYTRDDGIKIRVIAGHVNGAEGAVTTIYADPTYLDVTMPAHTTFAHPIELGHTAFAYVFAGAGKFEASGKSIAAPRLVVFGNGDSISVTTHTQPVRFVLVSGKPLSEPMVRYGPLVMNTHEEILQALRDLQNGTFVRD